jgi:hypothetical protein
MDADSGRHSSEFPVELFERIENGFADLDERWTDPHRTPVAQGPLADLPAIALNNLLKSEKYWALSPARRGARRFVRLHRRPVQTWRLSALLEETEVGQGPDAWPDNDRCSATAHTS